MNVHTGSGANTTGNVYWRSDKCMWNNTGDTPKLKNANGVPIDTGAYTAAAYPESFC